ncbi:MAG TPA: glycosyltransferase family 2 protein [Phycisphaerae bacterium]|nr:glycosyltransferase family 2 protein [Phycisphaerae bacterium]HNU46925.1 glycosyltransferase family 2 protein [Phycisphaerae bacterium]
MHHEPQATVSLVVPLYNEEHLVERLHGEILAAMQRVDLPWELIYVNDGSTDNTRALLLGLHERDERVVVVDLTRNWGHQSALSAGLSLAKGDAVILMDGDLQDPPGVIPDLIATWQKGAQVVVARRRTRGERRIRKWMFTLFYRLLGFLSDFPIPLNAGIFGLLDRQPADAIRRLGETNRYLPGLRAWVGYRTEVVLYDRADRVSGKSKQGFGRLLRYALDAIFSFSYKPLRLSLGVGVTVSAAALVYGAALIISRTMGVGMFGIPVVDGYTSTIVSILFLGGVQLMSVGILGEYIGRIYDEVKRRPLFLVQGVHGRHRAVKTAGHKMHPSPEPTTPRAEGTPYQPVTPRRCVLTASQR